mmetsp:Transcript_87243/g.233633  ORF Transcript_87243/g.233633 Transcript_87243/m.233633 type:complete len:214 (-) Transcript_87243:131-772(-)
MVSPDLLASGESLAWDHPDASELKPGCLEVPVSLRVRHAIRNEPVVRFVVSVIYADREVLLLRRYREFLWLDRELKLEKSPMPAKRLFPKRRSVVRERLSGLQTFLNKALELAQEDESARKAFCTFLRGPKIKPVSQSVLRAISDTASSLWPRHEQAVSDAGTADTTKLWWCRTVLASRVDDTGSLNAARRCYSDADQHSTVSHPGPHAKATP